MECNHTWEVIQIRVENDPSTIGTLGYEVAYVVCPRCGAVKKEKVN